MQVDKLTIVGVGLIGGSIGLAAKRRGVAKRIVGVGWRQSTLNLAQDLGIIDVGHLEISTGVAQADVVVFCTPVDVIAAQVQEAIPHCRPGTLLTDAGSTKAQIVRELAGQAPSHVYFVGSHPLAGSEKRGPEHASATLFQERLTVVTPTADTAPEALARTKAFWQALGSRVQVTSPEEHDAALALTSHLPHVLASALAGSLPAELAAFVATGFRDTTRIAASDPGLWTGILLQNRDAILGELDRLINRLGVYRSALAVQDTERLRQLWQQGKDVRDGLDA